MNQKHSKSNKMNQKHSKFSVCVKRKLFLIIKIRLALFYKRNGLSCFAKLWMHLKSREYTKTSRVALGYRL